MFGLNNVSFSWNNKRILDNFSLDFSLKQTTVLLGASGVGKSTILKLLAGLVSPQGGVVASDRTQIAWMGQQDQLYPWLSVIENVCLPTKLRGIGSDRARAEHLLAEVGLAKVMHDNPHQLSGGMRQRVALARTLYADRDYVLMDEPFGMLDVMTKLRLQTLTAKLLVNKTVVMVTHDPLEACRLADHILLLRNFPLEVESMAVPSGQIPRSAESHDLLVKQAELFHRLGEL